MKLLRSVPWPEDVTPARMGVFHLSARAGLGAGWKINYGCIILAESPEPAHLDLAEVRSRCEAAYFQLVGAESSGHVLSYVLSCIPEAEPTPHPFLETLPVACRAHPIYATGPCDMGLVKCEGCGFYITDAHPHSLPG